MSRPIFVAESAPVEFADYLQACADAVTRTLRSGDVPEPAHVSIADHRLTITPWLPGAPLTGLLAWASFVDGAAWAVQVHELHDGRPLASIYVVGTLDGLPVELIGGSWRPLSGIDVEVRDRRQPVDVAAVRAIAAQEEPIR